MTADVSRDSQSRPATATTSEPNYRNHSVAAAAQPKRQKPRMRKNDDKPTITADGTLSDGALMHPSATPRSRRSHHPNKQPSLDAAISPNDSMAGVYIQQARPVSVAGTLFTPAKEQAYAGATFQASPAASSLPMPKFLSRSVPSAPKPLSSPGQLVGGKAPDPEASSPEPDIVVTHTHFNDQQSPLDVFFKADRAEREKRRAESSLPSPRSPPPSGYLTNGERYTTRNEKRGFMSELDGHSFIDISSPQATPLSHSNNYPNGTDDERQRIQSQTDSLKAMLFKTADEITPPSLLRSKSGSRASGSPVHTPSPLQRSYSGPVTPQASTEQQHNPVLHYGNRNLSPMFKAARVETPRPSGLRHQVPEHAVRNQPFAVDIPLRSSFPQPVTPERSNSQVVRNYLNQHIQSSTGMDHVALAPCDMVQYRESSSGASTNSASTGTSNSNGFAPSTSSTPPKSPSPDEYSSIENELRRVLKLK